VSGVTVHLQRMTSWMRGERDTNPHRQFPLSHAERQPLLEQNLRQPLDPSRSNIAVTSWPPGTASWSRRAISSPTKMPRASLLPASMTPLTICVVGVRQRLAKIVHGVRRPEARRIRE